MKQPEDNSINQTDIEQQLERLKKDLSQLASEIDGISADFQLKPEKYDALSLQELMHVHGAEVTRIRGEMDHFEDQLLVERLKITNKS